MGKSSSPLEVRGRGVNRTACESPSEGVRVKRSGA